jgi:hypothetical protein
VKLPALEDVVNRPGIAVGAGDVRVSPDAISTRSGAYLGQAADAALGLGGSLKQDQRRAQEQSDAVAAQKVVTETNFEWAKRLQEAQQSAPEGAAGFGEQIGKTFQDDAAERLAQIPESARSWAEGQFQAMQGDYGLKALDFEHKAGQAKQLTDLYDIADMNANGVRGDFGQFDQAMARTTAAIAGSGLSADNKRVATAKAKETIAISALQGEIERNPDHAKQMLAAGGFDAVLAPGNKDRLLGSADLEIKRRQDEVERRRREADIDRRAAIADVREEGRFLMAALDSGVVPAGYDDTIKKLQALGDGKTATAMQLAKGDVQWTQDLMKLSPAEIRAELDRTRTAIGNQPDAVIAADLAGKVKAGEKILDEKSRVEIAGIRDEASNALVAIGGGNPYAGLDDLIGRAAAADPSTAQVLRQARTGAAQAVDLTKLAPAEIRKRLDSMGTDAAATGDAQWAATLTQRQDRGEKVLARLEEGLREDPLGTAESTGVVQPTDLFGALAAAADSGDTSKLPAALQARQQANAQVKARYGVQPAVMKPAEAKAYVDAYNKAPNTDAKNALLAPFYSLTANQAQPILDQLMQQKGGEDFGMLAGIGMDDPATARDIIAGQEAAAKIKGVKPEDGADLRDAISGSLGNLLLTTNPTARAAIEKAAVSLYAKLSADAGDNSGTIDPSRMQTALDRVTGGVISYRDQSILPPATGMSEAGFGDLVGTIDDAYLRTQIGASRTGAAIHPVYGNGVAVTAQDLREIASFQSAGKSSYFVLIDGEPVRDATSGRPFEIDLGPLMKRGAP